MFFRATLVFASSGLDSVVKHLLEDALPAVIRQDENAREKLRGFVLNRIKQDDQPNYKLLASALVTENPIEKMITYLTDELKSNSLQSDEQLSRVSSFFGISDSEIFTDRTRLKQIFQMRNEIIHEMDIDLSSGYDTTPYPPSGQSLVVQFRPRELDSIEAATQELLNVAGRFLTAVDAKLTPPA